MIYYKSDKRMFVLFGVAMSVYAFLMFFPIMYLPTKIPINIVYAALIALLTGAVSGVASAVSVGYLMKKIIAAFSQLIEEVKDKRGVICGGPFGRGLKLNLLLITPYTIEIYAYGNPHDRSMIVRDEIASMTYGKKTFYVTDKAGREYEFRPYDKDLSDAILKEFTGNRKTETTEKTSDRSA